MHHTLLLISLLLLPRLQHSPCCLAQHSTPLPRAALTPVSEAGRCGPRGGAPSVDVFKGNTGLPLGL
jgi:hypothetical protein